MAPSASTSNLGLDGASLAAPRDEAGGGVDDELDAASGANEVPEGTAAASSEASAPASSLMSLWEDEMKLFTFQHVSFWGVFFESSDWNKDCNIICVFVPKAP